MSAAVQRFDDLRKKFRAMVPARQLKPTQKHSLLWAASLQQVVEITIAELVLGKPHDRRLIKEMQMEVRARLAGAGVPQKEEERNEGTRRLFEAPAGQQSTPAHCGARRKSG
jgi:hypothetical protein